MNTTRRTIFKGLLAAGALPLFNIGCAGFGLSRARQIARGAKIRVALIGCGLQMGNMIDGVLCEDLVAIVDPDPARFAWLDKVVAETCGAEIRNVQLVGACTGAKRIDVIVAELGGVRRFARTAGVKHD